MFLLDPSHSPRDSDLLYSDKASRFIAAWIEEAAALPSRGMPAAAFSVTFESEAPDSTQEILDLVHFDATRYELGVSKCCWARSFPRLVQEIARGTSNVRFNAVLASESYKTAMAKCDELESLEEKTDEIMFHRPRELGTKSPMPRWLDLQLDYVLPSWDPRRQSGRYE